MRDGRIGGWDTRDLEVRRALPVLRRGRQYLRPVSADGVVFALPEPRGVLPWSRIFADREVLVAVNTDPERARRAGPETQTVPELWATPRP